MKYRWRKLEDTPFPVYRVELDMRGWYKDATEDLLWDLAELCDVQLSRKRGARIVLLFPKKKPSDEVMERVKEIYLRNAMRRAGPLSFPDDDIPILERRRNQFKNTAAEIRDTRLVASEADIAKYIADGNDALLAEIHADKAARAAK